MRNVISEVHIAGGSFHFYAESFEPIIFNFCTSWKSFHTVQTCCTFIKNVEVDKTLVKPLRF